MNITNFNAVQNVVRSNALVEVFFMQHFCEFSFEPSEMFGIEEIK